MKGLVLAILLGVIAGSSAYLQAVRVRDGLSGNANTTRYWDCCKPACSWPHDTLSAPVVSCEIDGESEIHDTSVTSGCQDGTAFACTKQHCYAVNETFALGTTSAFFGGVAESQCCNCFLLSFQGLSTAKQMIVQVINTGDDYAKDSVTFDLSVPGGGVGFYDKGCPAQWNSPAEGWGERYGGVKTREECYQLPTQLQEPCTFRFDFLEGISNPPATFTQVECPAELTVLTECAHV